MITAAAPIPPLAYLINIAGAILGLVVGGYLVFNPEKANKYFGRGNTPLESHPEDYWWQRYFVLSRIVGAVMMTMSVAAILSTVRSLLG